MKLMILGLVCLGAAAMLYYIIMPQFEVRRRPKPQRGRKMEAKPLSAYRSVSKTEQLFQLQAGQALTLFQDAQRTVLGTVVLEEMEQKRPDASWTPKGPKSTAIALAGDIWLMRIPMGELGRKIWLKMKPLPVGGLRAFYIGGDDEASLGPARRFGRIYRQQKPVPYTLPGNATPGVTWEVVDLGAFHAEMIDGHTNDVAHRGDLFMTVTSREQNGNRWLLFLDPRKVSGFTAEGSGGLFIGESFNPESEVVEIL